MPFPLLPQPRSGLALGVSSLLLTACFSTSTSPSAPTPSDPPPERPDPVRAAPTVPTAPTEPAPVTLRTPPDRRGEGHVVRLGPRKTHLGEPVGVRDGQKVLAVCGDELSEQTVQITHEPAVPWPRSDPDRPDNPKIDVPCTGTSILLPGVELEPRAIPDASSTMWGLGELELPPGYAVRSCCEDDKTRHAEDVHLVTPDGTWLLWDGTAPIVHLNVPIAGDLDGDGELDLILDVHSGDHPPPRLFLSKGGFHLAATGLAGSGTPPHQARPRPAPQPAVAKDEFEDCASATTRILSTTRHSDGRWVLRGTSPEGEVRWEHAVAHPASGVAPGHEGASFRDVHPLCLIDGHPFTQNTYVVHVEEGVRFELDWLIDPWLRCGDAVFIVEATTSVTPSRLHRLDPATVRSTHQVSLPGHMSIRSCDADELVVATSDGTVRLRQADLTPVE